MLRRYLKTPLIKNYRANKIESVVSEWKHPDLIKHEAGNHWDNRKLLHSWTSSLYKWVTRGKAGGCFHFLYWHSTNTQHCCFHGGPKTLWSIETSPVTDHPRISYLENVQCTTQDIYLENVHCTTQDVLGKCGNALPNKENISSYDVKFLILSTSVSGEGGVKGTCAPCGSNAETVKSACFELIFI